MVELAEIQFAYYMLAATGVLVAAIYYIITLRYNMKAREMEIARYFTSEWLSDQGFQKYAIVMTMAWKDHEDFMANYGQSNPEMYGKWVSLFFSCEMLGILLKNKIVEAEKLYALGGFGVTQAWEKYKDIIQSRRDAGWGQDLFVNFEFFAKEMLKMKMKKDASFKDKLSGRLTKTRNTRPANQNQ